MYIYIYIHTRCADGSLRRHKAPFLNIVKRSRVQWMRIEISKCDFEHAAQVFCRRRADSSGF